MDYWQGPARWINTLLLVIVGFVGLATLFDLLGALEDNMIVRFVNAVSNFFLAPFVGMFDDQEFLLTAIIAVLGYSLAAGIALAVTRSIQASRRERPPKPPPLSRRPQTPPHQPTQDATRDDDVTRRL